jgi:hypothetical protein
MRYCIWCNIVLRITGIEECDGEGILIKNIGETFTDCVCGSTCRPVAIRGREVIIP